MFWALDCPAVRYRKAYYITKFSCTSDTNPAADIFFKTTQCLRLDTSTCLYKTDENYMITHSGLDAQVR